MPNILKIGLSIVLLIGAISTARPPATAFVKDADEKNAGSKDKNAGSKSTSRDALVSARSLRAFVFLGEIAPLFVHARYLFPNSQSPLLWLFAGPGSQLAGDINGPITPLEAAGFVVGMAGVALRHWSFQTLGKFFTYEVRTFDEHKLITTGPYALLMHPSYTGLAMAFAGYGMFIGYFNAKAIAMSVVGGVALGLRVINEENALRQHFTPEKWDAYARKRWRLIPYIF
ncbi:hypothetical protein RI367_001043 [Sorochytrium milnesiophthora]